VKNNPARGYADNARQHLESICRHLPVVKRILSEYGNTTLANYLQQFPVETPQPYQQPDDLHTAAYRYVQPLLGETVAQQVANDIAHSPIVLTTNHDGVDFFPNSIQGSLIFSLPSISGHSASTTVPVFSFGNIPLNNATFPRGLLLYQADHDDLNDMPLKIPLFGERLKRTMVSVAPAFDQDMICRIQKQTRKLADKRRISAELELLLHTLFEEEYCADCVMQQPRYSRQAVILNNRIWKRLFADDLTVPELVCLEIEKIAVMLLESDLSNPQSLAWRAMFDSGLGECLLEKLDGVRGCWNRENLRQRFEDKTGRQSGKQCGTFFFWGVDASGRRIPLEFNSDASGKKRLEGIDDHGNPLEVSCTPDAILAALNEERLIPSLFTCFLTIAFARGVVCVGGDFQCEYLPQMQRGVVHALNQSGYQDIGDLVAKVKTDCYQDCMLTAMCSFGENALIPAGTVEIISGGGITATDMEKMLSLTVREAHLAGLFETIPSIMPPRLRPPGWKEQLAADCFQLLKEKIVIK